MDSLCLLAVVRAVSWKTQCNCTPSIWMIFALCIKEGGDDIKLHEVAIYWVRAVVSQVPVCLHLTKFRPQHFWLKRLGLQSFSDFPGSKSHCTQWDLVLSRHALNCAVDIEWRDQPVRKTEQTLPVTLRDRSFSSFSISILLAEDAGAWTWEPQHANHVL